MARRAFLDELAALFERSPAGTLLAESGIQGIAQALNVLRDHGAELVTGGRAVEDGRFSFANTLLRTTGAAFLKNPHAMQTEAFGTVNTVVVADDLPQMIEIAAALDGSLTGCLYSAASGTDDDAYTRVASVLRHRVGRLLNDKMPTGVAVVTGDESRRAVSGDRPSWLYRRRNPGVDAEVRGAPLLRQCSCASTSARARRQEPDGKHVAMHRRRVDAARRRTGRVTPTELTRVDIVF